MDGVYLCMVCCEYRMHIRSYVFSYIACLGALKGARLGARFGLCGVELRRLLGTEAHA